MMFIDEQPCKKCWNLYDSYGMICVHCGCCARDREARYRARIRVIEGWLHDCEHFDLWDEDPELRAVQEKNVRSDIRSFKRMLRYYRGKLAEGGAAPGETEA